MVSWFRRKNGKKTEPKRVKFSWHVVLILPTVEACLQRYYSKQSSCINEPEISLPVPCKAPIWGSFRTEAWLPCRWKMPLRLSGPHDGFFIDYRLLCLDFLKGWRHSATKSTGSCRNYFIQFGFYCLFGGTFLHLSDHSQLRRFPLALELAFLWNTMVEPTQAATPAGAASDATHHPSPSV